MGRWILTTLKGWVEKALELPAVQIVFDKAGITGALQPSGRKASSLLRQQRNIGWLPTATRAVILIVGVLAALDLLEIRFAEDIVKIFSAAAGIAFAVPFGVGGIETAKQWWNGYLAPKSWAHSADKGAATRPRLSFGLGN